MDVALLPWAFRFYIFEHYRGPAFAIPREDPALAAYFAWLDHALDLPQVLLRAAALVGITAPNPPGPRWESRAVHAGLLAHRLPLPR